MGLGGQRHSHAALPRGSKPGTHCTGTWMGSKAFLEECGKLVPTGFDLRTSQPVANLPTPPSRPTNRLLRSYRVKSPNMIVVCNAGYCCVFAVYFHQVEYVTLEQMPSNDIRKKDWIVLGGLFHSRVLICFPPHQRSGESVFVRFSIAKVSDFNSNIV